MFNIVDWFKGLFGGNNAKKAYDQVPQAQKDLVAYKAGVGAGVPGRPETYATTAPIDNIPAKYVPTATAPANTGYASGGAGGSAAPSGPSFAPGSAPGDIQSKINSINGLYSSIFGNLDRVATDKTNSTIKNYGDQNTQLGNDFAQNALQTANAYGGRGIADSSYYTNAKNTAKDIYDTNVGKLKTGQENDLAAIGQNLAQTKAGYNSTKSQIESYVPKLGSMTAADLVALGQNLDQIYRQATADSSGIGTTQDFLSKLSAITPYQQTGSDQLRANLDKIVKSNTTQSAKDSIAAGLINSTPGADNNTWMDYYKKITQGGAA
jgi:hypothetical protein